jgi:hypothetical protein
MASSKVIGGPFDAKVLKQLEVRSNLMSKPNRDDNTLRYLASRTGWVKMTSSVRVNGTDNLANKYVLIGGTYGRTGDKTYSNFPNGKGFRPMPGITGVDIKSINKFGLLKEATITYNCWDVGQLQELEMLFMRPGFSVLLEWGHSVYYTTDQNFVSVPQTITSFLTPGTTKEKLYKEIETLKEQSGYNYDAIYGFIKNFSWSFRADGGYDCVTSLTSIGEIIESLQIDIDNPLPQGATAAESNAKSEEFVEAAKKKAELLEKTPEAVAKDATTLEYIVIGDSQTANIASYCTSAAMIGTAEGIPTLHQTGQNLKWLTEAVGVYPISDKVKGVVVSIGTNGGFNKNDDVATFKAAINRVFPNATKLIVVKGSWGWGNNKSITPKEVNAYYDKFQKIGFTATANAVGDMTLYDKYANRPHNAGLPTYAAIGKEVDNLLK